ncbi:unnamed protein product [Durusdinium trenchii]|uniref:Plastidal glycolate/glycerate translocator 1, chloroplastic n=2 Tax=Durusdinium trenchii TaxID=1381693 RepID=A0ABP0RT43_9DINO
MARSPHLLKLLSLTALGLSASFACSLATAPRASLSIHRPLTGRRPHNSWGRLRPTQASESTAVTKSYSEGTWKEYLQLNLQRIFGIGAFIAVYFLQRVFGSRTPVGGMLIVFFSMLGLEAVNPSLAQRVFKLLEPGYRFLVKWLIVFFVPALVRVSLIHAELGVGGLIRVLLLLLVGWFITFGGTAAVASAFPEVDLEVNTPTPATTEPKKEPEKPPPAPVRFPYIRFVVGMAVALVAASFGFKPGLDQTIFMTCAALAGFTLAKRLPGNVQKFIHPLFICAAATFAAAGLWIFLEHPGLHTMDVIRIYSDWPGGGALLYFLLPIAVVSLGLLLFENRLLIRKDLGPILATAAFSSTLTIGSAPLLSRLFHLPRSFALSTTARCALSPIAMGMASILGSPPPIAVAMTTFSGVLGVMLGPTLFKVLKLRKARARGLALGCSSHGVGVVPIATSDRQAFAYGCVGLILIATMNMLVMQTPFFRKLVLAAIPP